MLDQEPGEHASEIKNRRNSQRYSTIVNRIHQVNMDIINVVTLTKTCIQKPNRHKRCVIISFLEGLLVENRILYFYFTVCV